MKEITVFTATYNRAYTLGRLYDSLLKQSFEDFEWLIVDDGSTDETYDLIRRFKDEGRICIRYYRKENGGKHTAMNLGIKVAEGRLFFPVDSDDFLCNNALEYIDLWNRTIKGLPQFAGVSGLRITPDGETIGYKWTHEKDFVDATNFQRKKLKLLGDKAEAYYTDILREYYPFPVIEGEKCMMEAVLWNRIAYAGYKLRWFNEALCVCKYLPDGMTVNSTGLYLNNFKGYTLWKKELIDMQSNYINVIRELSSFVGLAVKKGLSFEEMVSAIGRKPITISLAKVHLALHNIKYKYRRK